MELRNVSNTNMLEYFQFMSLTVVHTTIRLNNVTMMGNNFTTISNKLQLRTFDANTIDTCTYTVSNFRMLLRNVSQTGVVENFLLACASLQHSVVRFIHVTVMGSDIVRIPNFVQQILLKAPTIDNLTYSAMDTSMELSNILNTADVQYYQLFSETSIIHSAVHLANMTMIGRGVRISSNVLVQRMFSVRIVDNCLYSVADTRAELHNISDIPFVEFALILCTSFVTHSKVHLVNVTMIGHDVKRSSQLLRLRAVSAININNCTCSAFETSIQLNNVADIGTVEYYYFISEALLLTALQLDNVTMMSGDAKSVVTWLQRMAQVTSSSNASYLATSTRMLLHNISDVPNVDQFYLLLTTFGDTAVRLVNVAMMVSGIKGISQTLFQVLFDARDKIENSTFMVTDARMEAYHILESARVENFVFYSESSLVNTAVEIVNAVIMAWNCAGVTTRLALMMLQAMQLENSRYSVTNSRMYLRNVSQTKSIVYYNILGALFNSIVHMENMTMIGHAFVAGEVFQRMVRATYVDRSTITIESALLELLNVSSVTNLGTSFLVDVVLLNGSQTVNNSILSLSNSFVVCNVLASVSSLHSTSFVNVTALNLPLLWMSNVFVRNVTARLLEVVPTLSDSINNILLALVWCNGMRDATIDVSMNSIRMDLQSIVPLYPGTRAVATVGISGQVNSTNTASPSRITVQSTNVEVGSFVSNDSSVSVVRLASVLIVPSVQVEIVQATLKVLPVASSVGYNPVYHHNVAFLSFENVHSTSTVEATITDSVGYNGTQLILTSISSALQPRLVVHATRVRTWTTINVVDDDRDVVVPLTGTHDADFVFEDCSFGQRRVFGTTTQKPAQNVALAASLRGCNRVGSSPISRVMLQAPLWAKLNTSLATCGFTTSVTSTLTETEGTHTIAATETWTDTKGTLSSLLTATETLSKPSLTVSEELNVAQVIELKRMSSLLGTATSIAVALSAVPQWGSAVAVHRLLRGVSVAACDGSDGLGEPLDVASSPLRLAVGDDAAQYARGAVLGNFALCVAAIAVGMCVVIIVALKSPPVGTVPISTNKFAVTGMPIGMVPLISVLVPPTVTSTASLLWLGDIVVAVVGILLCGSLCMFHCWHVCRTTAAFKSQCIPAVRRHPTTQYERCVAFLAARSWRWVDRSKANRGFSGTYGALFEPFRNGAHWWGAVDLLVSVAAAGLGGLLVSEPTACTAVALTIAAFSAVLVLLVLWLRPYDTVLDIAQSVAANVLTCVGVGLAVWGDATADSAAIAAIAWANVTVAALSLLLWTVVLLWELQAKESQLFPRVVTLWCYFTQSTTTSTREIQDHHHGDGFVFHNIKKNQRIAPVDCYERDPFVQKVLNERLHRLITSICDAQKRKELRC